MNELRERSQKRKQLLAQAVGNHSHMHIFLSNSIFLPLYSIVTICFFASLCRVSQLQHSLIWALSTQNNRYHHPPGGNGSFTNRYILHTRPRLNKFYEFDGFWAKDTACQQLQTDTTTLHQHGELML